MKRLLDDVRHGRASSVGVEQLGDGSTASRVRWKTSLVAWHAATTSKPVDQIQANLEADAGPAGIRVDTVRSASVAGLHMNLRLFTIGVWEPLAVITGAIWLATFLGMLFTGGHPYANRWAWFWLFVVGGVGPMLILWKEPTPLRIRFWRRRAEPSRRPPRSPMTGGVGLLTAIGWAIVLTGGPHTPSGGPPRRCEPRIQAGSQRVTRAASPTLRGPLQDLLWTHREGQSGRVPRDEED